MEVVINGNKYLSQSEVDAIRADTWYAARKITDKVVGEIDFKDGDRCPFYEKYFNSINDYLSSLNLNSNDTGKEDKWPEYFKIGEIPTNDNAFMDSRTVLLLKEILDYFDMNTTKVPPHLYKALFNSIYPSKQSAPEPSALPNKEWKEWKIVDIMDDNGQIISNPSTDIIHMVLKHRGERIHSVRRESDKEIFTIGDKISWGCTGVYETTLTAFEIKNNRLKFYYDKLPENANPCDFLDAINLYKLPTPTQPVVDKQIMFTTEDGKPIPQCYEDEIWRVFTEPSSFASWVPVELGMPQYLNQGEKYFSTKVAAEQYIDLNKKQFSKNDIINLLK